MNKEYKIKLDLNKKLYNKKMAFNQFDKNVNDFYIEITKNNEVVKDLDKSIITLVAIKPNNTVDAQFIEVKEGQIYADLKPSMCDLVGNYQAKAMIVLEGEIVTTDTINYSVNEDKIISKLNDDVVSDERFTLFTDALARLSTIEISEEQRVINEAERILSEENRKIEEAKRVEAELIRQHEEADRSKYDAIRESNENIRKQNESIRLANETNRIDEESKRVEEENKRKLAEEERNANYNFMTEDEERRRSEANAHKEAEVLRVQAETNRVNEEAKRRTTEQGRVSAENTRVSNENTREANEETRQNNETKRVEAETQRQNRYNSFILDAEANANNFENYTNNAKVKEEERKANELDRKSQEVQRISNENERISNENSRKANEVVREENEISRQDIFEDKVDEFNEKIVELNTTKDNFVSSINTKVDNKISELDNAKSDMTNTVSNKVNEVENRFNALTSKQQQDAEVIDARDGETSLKARLDRDIEKAKQVYVNVEGSHISTDSSVGYLKDVEILGNTIQDASNLADIRSVGDTVEGQELYEIPVLSRGKNLFDIDTICMTYGDITKISNNEIQMENNVYNIGEILKLDKSKSYKLGGNFVKLDGNGISCWGWYDSKGNIHYDSIVQPNWTKIEISFTDLGTSKLNNPQIEEGTVATPYEPYQEDKLTILSPVQLEKVGDVADRIIEKDGVWGVEKNVVTYHLKDFTQSNYSNFACRTVLPKFGIVPNNHTTVPFYTNLGYMHTNINYQWNNRGIDSIAVSRATISGQFEYVCDVTSENYVYNDVVKMIKDNDIWVKYALLEPQFIPLPHDQQIKLRTFANKTNISFLTEIEGTIKAQVPKSLGATVNTHTEQISNLNKELDRVKKLEESTVSTVTTESDFTTVEATSNGYFEDVKLEGKTLVNLWGHGDVENTNVVGKAYSSYRPVKGKVTLLFDVKSDHTTDKRVQIGYSNSILNGNQVELSSIKTLNVTSEYIRHSILLDFSEEVYPTIRLVGASGYIRNCLILEGDHTQNPPSYFEGLKSVGQSATTLEDGADEIVVSSVNENLIPNIKFKKGGTDTPPYNNLTYDNTRYRSLGDFIFLPKGEYCINSNQNISFKVKDMFGKDIVDITGTPFTFSNPINQYVYIFGRKGGGEWDLGEYPSDIGLTLTKGKDLNSYTPHKSDKKRLLYYNNETQAWEKPILRQWDSIEKHADGKYYYHQRSGEVVLNGSEDWNIRTDLDKDNNSLFTLNIGNGFGGSNDTNCISNRFIATTSIYSNDTEGFYRNAGHIYIRINKSKLSTQDVAGFKQWLQANNVTVVYQLAQEKVYECTNIDLITYANETNYIVESGTIAPKSILKVHNNISNVVKILQEKVSLLESNVKASQEVQDMMILETDMRMLDIELALMDFMPMTLNLGGSNMLRSATYFNFLKNHIINETYEKEYLENVMNKYLATGRINQDEYNELYKMLYPPVYDIELPIEY